MVVAHEIDKISVIVSWKEEQSFTIMNLDTGDPDSMPEDTRTLGNFLDGMNPRRKIGKKCIKFRLHSKKMETILEEGRNWAAILGYSLYKCIIQAERAVSIGWLVYSSQHTDTEYLSRVLKEK